MKYRIFCSVFLGFVGIFFNGCIPLEISDDSTSASADASRRIASWYAYDPSSNGYTFCKAVLSYNDKNELVTEKNNIFCMMKVKAELSIKPILPHLHIMKRGR